MALAKLDSEVRAACINNLDKKVTAIRNWFVGGAAVIFILEALRWIVPLFSATP
jgi:hypothetical protein